MTLKNRFELWIIMMKSVTRNHRENRLTMYYGSKSYKFPLENKATTLNVSEFLKARAECYLLVFRKSCAQL